MRALLSLLVFCVSVIPLASQTLSIQSIDASAFPKITSVVRYSAVTPKTSPLSAADLQIVDAGSVVPAESVICTLEPPEPLHICFVLDFKNYEYFCYYDWVNVYFIMRQDCRW